MVYCLFQSDIDQKDNQAELLKHKFRNTKISNDIHTQHLNNNNKNRNKIFLIHRTNMKMKRGFDSIVVLFYLFFFFPNRVDFYRYNGSRPNMNRTLRIALIK